MHSRPQYKQVNGKQASKQLTPLLARLLQGVQPSEIGGAGRVRLTRGLQGAARGVFQWVWHNRSAGMHLTTEPTEHACICMRRGVSEPNPGGSAAGAAAAGAAAALLLRAPYQAVQHIGVLGAILGGVFPGWRTAGGRNRRGQKTGSRTGRPRPRARCITTYLVLEITWSRLWSRARCWEGSR